MKKYIIASLIAITSVTFAQALVEQFYTLKSTHKGTYLGADAANFVGYLAPEYNSECGADSATTGFGSPACAVVKANVQSGALGISIPYYRIIQANHGTNIKNFAAWMEDNSVCGLPTEKTGMMGGQGCALIYASPYGDVGASAVSTSAEAEY